MVKVVGWLLVVVFLSGFVVAAASEISANFAVGDEGEVVEDYVYNEGFWSNHGNYVIGLLVILLVVYIILGRKKKTVKTRRVLKKKKVKKKRVLKKKKVKRIS